MNQTKKQSHFINSIYVVNDIFNLVYCYITRNIHSNFATLTSKSLVSIFNFDQRWMQQYSIMGAYRNKFQKIVPLSGYFKKVEAIIDSIVEFYRPLPPFAYYTILILWFGIGDLSKEVLLFLAAFAPIYSVCFRCERNKPRLYIECKILGSKSNECVF